MLSTLFVFASLCLFGLLFVFESADNASLPKLRPASLITWLVSGNWPAKVGAGLLILGIGALLRYALINVDAPPELKLGSGFVAVAILGTAALYLKSNAQRRAIYLALSGTAFAVAYLTAYAAYSFFHYLNSVSGLALLVVVSAAAGVFAVSSRAMSVAILAMAGAYIAPKFASNPPSPAELYGYYLAISAASLLMVRLRGWRPLIHLSFLFTLAGALFFGWTLQFYQSEHYLVMQPLLLALTALHLAMPIAERRGTHSQWLARFDTAYFILLPLVAAGLTLKILPEVSSGGGLGFGLLAMLWFVAAAVLGFLQRPQEALRHAFVAVLLAMVACAFSMSYMLRLMAGLPLAVAALGVAPRLGGSRRTQELLCGAVMLIGALHIVFSIMQAFTGPPFVNEIFAERALVGVLMGIGAWLAARSDVPSARYLTVMSVAWSVVAIVAELQHVQFVFLSQAVYATLLLAVLVSCGPWRAFRFGAVWRTWLLLLIVGSGIWAVDGAPWNALLAFGVITPVVFLWVAYFVGRKTHRGTEVAFDDSLVQSVALGLLPVASAVWVFALAPQLGLPNRAFEATLLVACALVASIAAEAWIPRRAVWYRQIWSLHFGVISAALLYAVLLHIERGLWPVLFEVLALAYMVVFIGRREKSAPPDVGWGVVVIAFYLVTQAMLLRLFGPAGTLNASDILQMKWPAVVSLLWALLGVGFCWWGAKHQSRAQWSAGMALLALATFKLVFRDFGTLDQLGNILALIGVGLLFLAVAWFAPIPPAASQMPPVKARPTGPLDDEKTAPIPLDSTSAGIAAMNVERADATEPPPNSPRVDGANQVRQRPSATSSGTNWLLIMVLLGLLSGVATLAYQWQMYARTQAQLKQKLNTGWREQAAPPTDTRMADASKQAAEAAAQAAQMAKVAAQSAQVTAVKVMPSVPIKVTDVCTTFVSQLPSDYVLYAGGNYKGADLDFQIDQSGHTASQFEVWVNEPGQKVVLALGAYEPSVWNIRWTTGTVLSGVFVSGYHRQAVAGLSSEVPVLNASYEEKSPCGYFYMDRADVAKSDATIRKVLGRSAQTYFLASDGKVTFGAPVYGDTQYLQSGERTVDSYRDKDAPLAGQAGIEQLMREGKLRRAIESDMQAWKAAVDRAQGVPKLNIVGATVQRTPRTDQIGGVYVVLKTMRFPAGLYGAHSVTFMVPRGVPMPQGNPGHSSVLNLNQYP